MPFDIWGGITMGDAGHEYPLVVRYEQWARGNNFYRRFR